MEKSIKVFSEGDLVYAKNRLLRFTYWPAQVNQLCTKSFNIGENNRIFCWQVTSVSRGNYIINFFGSWSGIISFKVSPRWLELDSTKNKERFETEELLLLEDFANASAQMDSIRKAQRLKKNNSELLESKTAMVPRSIPPISRCRARTRSRFHHLHRVIPTTSQEMSAASTSTTLWKRKAPNPITPEFLSQFQPRTRRIMLNLQVKRNSNVEI